MPNPKPTRRTQPSTRPPAKRRTAVSAPRELSRPRPDQRPDAKAFGRGFNPGFKRR